jgi:predicted ribosome quality control (RQC) complex YloA/Tae2 family protein
MKEEYNTQLDVVKHYLLDSNAGGILAIQKIYSGPHAVTLSLRGKGVGFHLWIGRGKEFQGMKLVKKPIEAELRIRDRFLEYLRANLKGSILHKLEMVGENIIIFQTTRKKAVIYWGWIWRDQRLNFTTFNPDKMEALYSWKDFKVSGTNKEEWLEQINEMKSGKLLIENEVNSLNREIVRGTRKRRKFLERKVKKIEQDLKVAKLWSEMQRMGTYYLVNTDEVDSIDVMKIGDVEVKLGKDKSAHEKINEIFNKSKRYKKAEKFIEARLQETLQEVEKLGADGVKIGGEEIAIINPNWVPLKRNIEKKVDGEYVILLSTEQSLRIGIGLSAKGNDELRNNWASSEDFWFHDETGTGPHIVVKSNRDFVWSQYLLTAIGSALIEYKKHKSDEISMIYTNIKNVKALKGAPGKVGYKKARHLRLVYQPNWREILSIIT